MYNFTASDVEIGGKSSSPLNRWRFSYFHLYGIE